MRASRGLDGLIDTYRAPGACSGHLPVAILGAASWRQVSRSGAPVALRLIVDRERGIGCSSHRNIGRFQLIQADGTFAARLVD
jgi:hypothetical protein